MNAFETLEFTKVIGILKGYAHTKRAKQQLSELAPLKDMRQIKDRSNLAMEARKMLEVGSPPLSSLDGLEQALPLLMAGGSLTPALIVSCASFLNACRRMQLYLEKMEGISPELSAWGLSVDSLQDLASEIERCIRGEQVDDRASAYLRDIRRQIEQTREKMRGKLESLLRAHPDWFMESFISQRGDRFVLPLKKAHKRDLPGGVVDISSTGSTLFIEPKAVADLRDDLSMLHIEENNEVLRILAELSQQLFENMDTLNRNRDCLERLDFIFAIGRLSLEMEAVPAQIQDKHYIRFEQGRHPLLPKQNCVPLDFFLGVPPASTGVVITGPNTGGKTVSLKTVGLFCLMAQSGLHVPCKEGAVFPILDQVLCDLGDGQSIEQSLSTFSSHVVRWVEILKTCTPDTLVLCDELGAGTDPQEGMGLAVAMLEALAQKGCLILATTHYPEVKVFASTKEGFLNASMAFDPATLSPLYKMELGKAGESCALLIASRLGLPKYVLESAAQTAGSTLPRPEVKQQRVQMPERQAEEEETPAPEKPQKRFEVGESVYIHPLKRTGIVAEPENAKGEVCVIAAGKRYMINKKRLAPHLSKEELYPDADTYDYSIILDSVANRKARKVQTKRHDKNAVVVIDEGKKGG